MPSLARIARRHGMPIWKALPYEAFIRGYQKPWLRGILRAPFPSRVPLGWIFVGGAYNAGTTIIKNALMAHPSLRGMPVEGDCLSAAFSNLEIGGYPRGMYANRDQIERERQSGQLDAHRICRDWSPWIRSDRYFLDKSIANTVRIPQFRRAFPGARFVMVVREPEDVARGIRKRSRPARGGEYSDEFLEKQWHYFYACLAQDAEADTVLCSYEAFIRSPLAETERLYRELGLEAVPMNMEGEQLTIGSANLQIRPLPREFEEFASAQDQLQAGLARIEQRYGSPVHGGQA